MYGQSFEVPESDDWTVPIGKAKVVRPGRDVTITAFSIMVGKALAAAEILAGEGIEAEVIDLRSLRPLDTETVVGSVAKTRRAVVVDEGWRTAGLSAEISAIVTESCFWELDAPVGRVCSVEVPIPYPHHLEQAALPQPPAIVAAAKATVS